MSHFVRLSNLVILQNSIKGLYVKVDFYLFHLKTDFFAKSYFDFPEICINLFRIRDPHLFLISNFKYIGQIKIQIINNKLLLKISKLSLTTSITSLSKY